ncbi:MAG TPA: 2-oxoglutarate and iron-dependent oxygenase domain-containing protein [Polyangiaceae bacterium]|nr:2-oxoglutarate and iron-dependent oxygenase domain-containing protein [Polyangiaceae bacterium]
MDPVILNETESEQRPTLDLPVLDLAAFEAGTAEQRREIAAGFDLGMQTIGFGVVAGHGIAPSLIERMFSTTSHFFELPNSDKAQVRSRVADGQFCGWVPFGADAASRVYGAHDDTPEDLRERFRAVVSDCAEVREKVGPNQWPTQPGNLAQVWTEYYRAVENMSLRVMQVSAVALGLEKHFFDPYFERHFSVLMATNSPPFTGPRKPGQARCGTHTDTGTMTFVYQRDTRGGLEVQVGGKWLLPAPPAGSFIVNCGDLLARWTNNRWKSTVHRVGGPGAAIDQRRVSVVFFHQPALDIPLESLPTCVDAEHPAQFDPITLREHFSNQQRRLKTRDDVNN